MSLPEKDQTTIQKEWKFYLGIGFFACSILADVIFLTVPFLGFSGTKIISLLAIFAAAAELFFLLSILLLGNIVIQKIKEKIQSWFKREKPTVPIYISKRRHYVGVILFFLSFIPYLIIEISLLLGYPTGRAQHVNFFIFLIAGDILFITSLFVLGDTFWEKMRALFKWIKPPVNNDKVKTT